MQLAGVPRGFTLIEALVALALMLAGIAGAAWLLLQSAQHERESATRRTAIRIAASLAEELRALAPPDAGTLPADSPVIAAWRDVVAVTMPQGADLSVAPRPSEPPAYRIDLSWPVAGFGSQRYTLVVTT